MQYLNVHIHRRFQVWREEFPRLGGVLELIEFEMKCTFHVRRLRRHVQQEPVAVFAGNFEAVGQRKIFHRRIIRFHGTKPGGKFRRRQEVPVVWARRVVNIRQKFVQSRRIAQRYTDGQM